MHLWKGGPGRLASHDRPEIDRLGRDRKTPVSDARDLTMQLLTPRVVRDHQDVPFGKSAETTRRTVDDLELSGPLRRDFP